MDNEGNKRPVTLDSIKVKKNEKPAVSVLGYWNFVSYFTDGDQNDNDQYFTAWYLDEDQELHCHSYGNKTD
eukprot:CAMPEP_0116898534 /NCGR_PEP_ID=MMETSP0467-20121206/7248_1 /TAXON_ID=283647 /ORGANISM="Mesodinium pulex, Strain SPMC105" /LENGTH=70 /DNA_ID=CAMNT_0004570741 /DNA_START=329 /DNA_END=541 /DNA_ORIENTATION=-